MARLTRIYTRLGDGGETHLGDMTRTSKAGLRVCAFGEVDEANSALGLVRAAEGIPDELDARLAQIQNDLFDLGADLCVPESPESAGRLRVRPEQVSRLERWCDEANESLAPLANFVLPAGSEVAARIHLARAVCRRAERSTVALAAVEPVNAEAIRYLNRLSDLLFILARVANRDAGSGDVLWVPGGG